MNAYRKFGRILAVTALTCLAASATLAADGGHSGGGHAGAGGGHAHFAAGGRAGGAHFAPGYRGGYGARGGYYGYGRGGYWHGGFYGPRFGYGYGWFLPVLPAFYATYWWGGIPYYYANNAYYTWSPDYNGYVATDPPAGAAGAPTSDNDPNANGAPPPAAGGGQMFNYPKNGQTEEQQATDRYQCHQWAVGQSGYDPTRNAAPTAAGQQVDYQRAITACMEGRGYSVRLFSRTAIRPRLQ